MCLCNTCIPANICFLCIFLLVFKSKTMMQILVGSIPIPFLLQIGDKITHKIQCILDSHWFSDVIRTGMPWCPGSPVSPGSPRWPWWRQHALNLILKVYEIICYQRHKYCQSHNTVLNKHFLVQETGSWLTPYHRPFFSRQPRSTSFPPIPLEK